MSNVAMPILLKFMSIFLHKLSEFAISAKLKVLADSFLTTLLKGHKYKGINRDDYQQLVVCEKCHCTYEYDECMKDSLRNRSNVKCVLIRFLKHPQARLRSPLLKAVKTSSHNSVYTPIKLFCYCSILKSISEYVQQVEYVNLFNKWKERIIPTLILADIYDGKIWMTLKNLEGENLFSDK